MTLRKNINPKDYEAAFLFNHFVLCCHEDVRFNLSPFSDCSDQDIDYCICDCACETEKTLTNKDKRRDGGWANGPSGYTRAQRRTIKRSDTPDICTSDWIKLDSDRSDTDAQIQTPDVEQELVFHAAPIKRHIMPAGDIDQKVMMNKENRENKEEFESVNKGIEAEWQSSWTERGRSMQKMVETSSRQIKTYVSNIGENTEYIQAKREEKAVGREESVSDYESLYFSEKNRKKNVTGHMQRGMREEEKEESTRSEGGFICTYCRMKFVQKTGLANHLLEEHALKE